MCAVEGEDRLQFPAELEGHLGRDLVGPVGDRRYEPPADRLSGEPVRIILQQIGAGVLDQRQHVADPGSQRREAFSRQDLGAMTGHSDAQHERNGGRAAPLLLVNKGPVGLSGRIKIFRATKASRMISGATPTIPAAVSKKKTPPPMPLPPFLMIGSSWGAP